MKDNFSVQSAGYAKFRPTYPQELYDFLFSLVSAHHTAWDCATGNGQVATVLAEHFTEVFGTDISENQLAHAVQKDNITYLLQSSDRSSFADQTFDLITVAQAIHWFDFSAFYAEVKRTLKPGGVIAVFGYGVMQIDEQVDIIIHKLYKTILGHYWDDERKFIDQGYQTLPFPFRESSVPELYIKTSWNFDQLIGYLNTWSAVQHYEKANNSSPIDLVISELYATWGAGQKEVKFPILLKVGQ
ncbi:Methyltransferase domain-containing protein [Pedobacter westerhofensis]|uniref:Methyltransferase domain-containing protein n=1 Tax=Pedobacter westerhofensis TaxID=425512 RepID=A0A521BH62_9SPHI|nr:class I SAM-dependent methyltransferase [Pedobacter westerhofensis]SMO46477.1 Methyltransferase domain-containing protein [Pedobacter westerhofensis]